MSAPTRLPEPDGTNARLRRSLRSIDPATGKSHADALVRRWLALAMMGDRQAMNGLRAIDEFLGDE